MSSEALLLAVSQTINALTFSQTHEVDEDFRSHNKATMSTLRPLKVEQRARVARVHGPHPPSVDFLGTQMLASYRGEAASVQLARELGDPTAYPTAISAMSNAQCAGFKREMKARIHEWEAAVRAATGQPVASVEQKAQLRPIYELYRASKIRLTTGESPAGWQTARYQSGRSSAAGTEVSQPAPSEDSVMSRSSAGPVSPSSARVSTSSSLRSSARSTTASATASATGRAASSSQGTPPVAPGAARPVGTSSRDRAMAVVSTITRPSVSSSPVDGMSMADLQAEKRKIKHVLHRFESRFAALYGEPPNQRDRSAFGTEYHRYGKLKAEIAKRESAESSP